MPRRATSTSYGGSKANIPGGVSGKGGGSPLTVVRNRSREVYARVLARLESADLDSLPMTEVLKIGELAGKYGVPTQKEQGGIGDTEKAMTAAERVEKGKQLLKLA